MIKFKSSPYLRAWVTESVSQHTIDIDWSTIAIIADIIKCSEGFPGWGEDATEFLSTLPTNLVDLYNAYGED